MQSLIGINKLSNLLLQIYSYKITRAEAKQLKLIDQIPKIVQMHNEMNTREKNIEKKMEEDFKKEQEELEKKNDTKDKDKDKGKAKKEVKKKK